jgi:hypothetical protein
VRHRALKKWVEFGGRGINQSTTTPTPTPTKNKEDSLIIQCEIE